MTAASRIRLRTWTLTFAALAGFASSVLVANDIARRNALNIAALDDALQAREAQLDNALGELDLFLNSDRYEYEEIGRYGTDDFLGLYSQYEMLVKRHPEGRFRVHAEARMEEIKELLRDWARGEQAAMKQARAMKDPEKALAVLEEADHPYTSAEFAEMLLDYQERAMQVRELRGAEEDLGLRLSNIRGEWARSSFGELYLPELRFDVVNTGPSSVELLKFVVQFFKAGTKEMLGDEVSGYAAMDLPFEPGQTRPMQIRGEMGYQDPWYVKPVTTAKIYAQYRSLPQLRLVREITFEYR